MSSIKLKHSGGNSVSLNPPTSAPTSSDVAFKLPTSDGSAGQVLTTDGSGNLSWVSQPFNMFDEFLLPSSLDIDTDVVLTGWTRVSNQFEAEGPNMSVSSGIFTFPVTGKYLVYSHLTGKRLNHDSSYVGQVVRISTDSGSNFSNLGVSYTNADSSGAHFQTTVSRIVDVTNASTFRIGVRTDNPSGRPFRYFGSTGSVNCNIQFMRLGDT